MITSWRGSDGRRRIINRSHSPSGFLDIQYAIREEGEQLTFRDFTLFIDPDDNITINGTVFRGTEGLWEILTRKNVNT